MSYNCERCGKLVEDKDRFGSGRFCSRACANSRVQTKEINIKRANTLSNKPKKEFKQICIVCGNEFTIPRYETGRLTKRKTCSQECLDKWNMISASKAGKASVSKQSDKRRSKNEIYFYELCKNYFNNVKHNEPIFNGWDADVIIEDYKLAVLWNGKWHYDQISKTQSLKQVQNRDDIKVKEITNCGYTPYIIKDMGKYNSTFVEDQFNKLIKYIEG